MQARHKDIRMQSATTKVNLFFMIVPTFLKYRIYARVIQALYYYKALIFICQVFRGKSNGGAGWLKSSLRRRLRSFYLCDVSRQPSFFTFSQPETVSLRAMSADFLEALTIVVMLPPSLTAFCTLSRSPPHL